MYVNITMHMHTPASRIQGFSMSYPGATRYMNIKRYITLKYYQINLLYINTAKCVKI